MSTIGERGTELFVPVAAGRIMPSDEVRALLDPEPTGCHAGPGCPAAGQGRWLHHVDKAGQRTTVNNGDGTFWNVSCPVPTCRRRAHR